MQNREVGLKRGENGKTSKKDEGDGDRMEGKQAGRVIAVRSK